MLAALFRIAALIVIVASLAIGWVWNDYRTSISRGLSVPEGERLHMVSPGTSFRTVAHDLARLGVIDDPRYLYWHARWTGQASAIKAGEYALADGMSVDALLEKMVAGDVVLHSLTLVEGWSYRQALTAVWSSPYIVRTVGDARVPDLMGMLGRPDTHPEGRFFADTYRFARGTTDIEFLRRALAQMDAYLTTAWAARAEDLPYESPSEALIMASIIEKETGRASERGRIAGVFVRRLDKGMLLQTDPTVIYGMGENFDGDLRRADLRRDTPYNTYVRSGLPPTPIAIPGAAAIDAALHPEDGDELFFVSKGDGSHHFSATYAEHQRAVGQYQLKRRTRSAPANTRTGG